MFLALLRIPWPRPRVYLVSEMLDRLLQGQDLVEEGALEHWFEQAELLLSGHLPSLLQFGLETLHRLQGTLCICKPLNILVTVPAGVMEWMQGEGGVGEIEVERGDESEALSVQGRDNETGKGVWKWPYLSI